MSVSRFNTNSDVLSRSRLVEINVKNGWMPLLKLFSCVLLPSVFWGCSENPMAQNPLPLQAVEEHHAPSNDGGSGHDDLTMPDEPELTHGQYHARLIHLDRKSRRISIKLKDGKRARLLVNSVAGDLDQFKVGESVVVTLSSHAAVHNELYLHPESGHVIDLPLPGSAQERENYNPYFHHAPTRHHLLPPTHDYLDVAGKVSLVDLKTHSISVNTRDHKVWTVIQKDDDSDRLELGESVIMRFTEIDAIVPAVAPAKGKRHHHGAKP